MQVREVMSTDVELVDRNDNLRMVEEHMAARQRGNCANRARPLP